MWTGLLAATGALASLAAHRVSAVVWAPAVQRGPAGVSHDASREREWLSACHRPCLRVRRRPIPTRRAPVGELVVDISEKTSCLIREEIELAKAEVSEKVNKLVRGSVVGIAAGVFVLMALAMFMHGIAWLLNDLFFEDNVWLGFLVEALFWLLVADRRGAVRLPLVPGRRAADA